MAMDDLLSNPSFLDWLRGKASGRGVPTWSNAPNTGRYGGYQGWQPGMPRAPGTSPGARAGGTYTPSGNMPMGAGGGGATVPPTGAGLGGVGGIGGSGIGGLGRFAGMPTGSLLGVALSNPTTYPDIGIPKRQLNLGLWDKLTGRGAAVQPSPVPIPNAPATPPPAQPIPPAVAGAVRPTPATNQAPWAPTVGTARWPATPAAQAAAAPKQNIPLPRSRPQQQIPLPRSSPIAKNAPLPQPDPRMAQATQNKTLLDLLFGSPVRRDLQTDRSTVGY